MTIPKQQPIEFKVGDQTFSLKMGITALIRMEKEFDLGFQQIMTDVFGPNMKMGDLLTVFHACMLGSTSSGDEIEDVTRDEAAEIIDKLGVDGVAELLAQAVEGCWLLNPPKREKPKPKVRGAGPAEKPASRKRAKAA